MGKQFKKDGLEVLLDLYDLHTKLFYNVLVDISAEDAANRLGTKANHVAWLAGSLVQDRFEWGKVLGLKDQQTSHELFKDHRGIQDGVTYPSLDEYRADWERISKPLRDAFAKAPEDKWNGPEPFGMPGNLSLFEVFGFGIDRESYCIGQIALYRRLMGYAAMKYE